MGYSYFVRSYGKVILSYGKVILSYRKIILKAYIFNVSYSQVYSQSSWILNVDFFILQILTDMTYGVGESLMTCRNICHYTPLHEKNSVQDLSKVGLKKKINCDNKNRLNVAYFLQSLTIRFNQVLGFSKAGYKIPPVTFYCKCCFPSYP